MKKICIFVECIAVLMLMTSCSTLSDMINDTEKEQYAVIENYEDNTNITITPENENYEKVIEEFTRTAAEEKPVEIPKKATKRKSIVFYQAPTKTVVSSDEDKEDEATPLIEVDIYVDGDTQYAEGYISSLSGAKYSFKMTKELIDLVDSWSQSNN